MKQVRHILEKDLRRLRWDVAGWCVLVVARTLVSTSGADIALQGLGPQLGIGQLSALLSLMHVLVLGFLVSRLVHDEPLVGYDAFWITRPIAPTALMTAKLVFAALFFLLIPLAAAVTVAAAFGTSAGDVAKTIPVFVLQQSILVTLLMALAAVTPSLTRYVLAMVCVIAGFGILMASTVLVALLGSQEIGDGGVIGSWDPTPAVVGGTVVALVALAVTFYQYRTRRRGRALAIAGIGVVILLVVREGWPWSFAAQPRAEAAGRPEDTPSLTVSLDDGRPRVNDGFTFRRRTPPRKEIAMRAIATGVSPEFNVRAIVARSRLDLPGGVVPQTGFANSNTALSAGVGGSTAGRRTSIEAALGGVRMLTRSTPALDVSSEQWPIVLRVDEADFVRYRSEPGRLTANLDLIFERPVVRGVLPIADGASAEVSGMRMSIVRVIRRATGCTVQLRRSHVESLFSVPYFRDVMYVLRNKTREEAAASDVQPVSQEGFSTGGFYLSAPSFGGRGFVLEQYELQFPSRALADGPGVDLDEAWLAAAELVILEALPAGRIARTVTIDGFRMAP